MAYIEYDEICFEMQAFFDDNCITKTDFVKDGEQRWKTLGMVNGVLLLFVGHLLYDDEDKEVVRIITARKATSHERKEYYGTR